MLKRIMTFIGGAVQPRKSWSYPVLFALAYLIVQLTQLPLYGVSWDEPLHRNWGKIFSLFLHSGDRRLLELMPGHGIDYGPLYFYVNYVLSEFFYNSGYLTFVEANHVLTVVVSAIAVGLTYHLGNMIGGRRIGFFAAVFIVLCPHFVAHAHYNPKDVPVMTALLLTATVFVAALRRQSKKLIVLSAFLFGFSIAVKVSGLLMAPVFVATYLVWLIDRMRVTSRATLFRQQIPVIVIGCIACVSALYLFWPSAWGDVLLIPRAVHFFLGKNFWPGQVLFFGTEYSGADLPFYYIPFEFAVSLPLLTLIACTVGMIVLVRSLRSSEKRVESFFLLLWILFPLLFSMKPGLVRYDGMRQFFFILPAIAIVAAVGLFQLLQLLQQKKKNLYSGPIFLALIFVSLASQVLENHPFEGSYRNEILQLMYKKDLDESFQIEYWGAVYKQGMDWLTENAEPNPVICVPTAGILVTWYPWREDFSFECSEKSDYVMFFTRYSESKAYRDLKNPVYVISRMKSALLLIYKVK